MKRVLRDFLSIFSVLLVSGLLITSTMAQDSSNNQTAGDVKGDEGTKVTKIGVLMPKVVLMEATGEVSPAEALRNTYGALLNSDSIEIVAISAQLTSLAIEEAVKKNCDYLLNIDLVQERKKKGGGLFGKIARDAGKRATWETANKVPYGGGTGGRIAQTTARSAIINTGYTMSNMSIEIKKDDKFTLDYKLSSARGEKLFSNSLEEKADKNTDDLLMNMITKSSEDLVSFLRKDLGKDATP